MSASLTLTSARIRTAKDIISAAAANGVTAKGAQIAMMTSCVEAGLSIAASAANPASLSYPHDWVANGDHDSVGPFQQRNAWGSMRERMTTVLSAGLFFNGGHEGQRGLKHWDYNSNEMSMGQFAQSVQVSAFPDRYAAYQGFAEYVDNLYSRVAKPAPHWNDELPVYDTAQMIALQVHDDGEAHTSIKNLQGGLRIWSYKAQRAGVTGAHSLPKWAQITGRWDQQSRQWAQIANRHKGFGDSGVFGPKGLAWIGANRFHLLAD